MRNQTLVRPGLTTIETAFGQHVDVASIRSAGLSAFDESQKCALLCQHEAGDTIRMIAVSPAAIDDGLMHARLRKRCWSK